MFTVHAFYKFTPLKQLDQLRTQILTERAQHFPQVIGTILIASEGINATIAAPAKSLAAFMQYLSAIDGIGALPGKTSYCEEAPFAKFKVKVRKEIVTLGVPGLEPQRQCGEYVEPKDWNNLIKSGIVNIDTRNRYETQLGRFRDAIDPATKNFREFPAFIEQQLEQGHLQLNQPVAMFCTGGIRCEKASAFLLQRGFAKVYHLKGGILNYLEQIPASESYWQGECFVFDERVSVDHSLTPGSYTQLPGSKTPVLKSSLPAASADTSTANSR
jgi:UPF0176 protein